MRLGDLFEHLGIAPILPIDHDLRVCDLTEDSRTVLPGSLFIARRGEKSDGRRFVDDAARAGAIAVLSEDPHLVVPPGVCHVLAPTGELNRVVAHIAERFYGHASSKLSVIGVTGTNGKTTTTFLIHQMLNALGIRCGLIGTVVIDDGVETAPATWTTPPALEISRTFARMLDSGCKAAVMEVSSHALHQQRVGAVRFVAGVFTNLTGDHLDYHKTMEGYADAKAMLFEMLPAGAVSSDGQRSGGCAIVNIQDPAHSRMVRDTRARIVRCAIDGPLPIRGGTAPESLITVSVESADTSGTAIELRGAFGVRRVRLPLVGAFNVMNALQAFASVVEVFGPGTQAGLSVDQIAGALASTAAPPGRLEPVSREAEVAGERDPISVFVDYAHTDDALRTVLTVVRDALNRPHASGKGQGRLWCVFGCGGDRDRTKRPRMGQVASELADRVVITSDNPRTEDAMSIIREVQGGVVARSIEQVVVEPDRERAIRLALFQAQAGDAVVIAGKGHEDYQILPNPDKPGTTITRPFDDRQIARRALEERAARSVRPLPETDTVGVGLGVGEAVTNPAPGEVAPPPPPGGRGLGVGV